MRDNVSEGPFSLFTSSDRAQAIAGDLMEEREKQGWMWSQCCDGGTTAGPSMSGR